jgi:hypothetical protein
MSKNEVDERETFTHWSLSREVSNKLNLKCISRIQQFKHKTDFKGILMYEKIIWSKIILIKLINSSSRITIKVTNIVRGVAS